VKTAESPSEPDPESDTKEKNKPEDGSVVSEPPIVVDAVVVIKKTDQPPTPNPLHPHPLPHRRNHDHRNLTIIFLTCVVVILSFNFTILKGNMSINQGVTRGIGAVDFVGDIFQSAWSPFCCLLILTWCSFL
jgi:hypothetical protein